MKKVFEFSTRNLESDPFTVKGGRYMIAVKDIGSGAVTLHVDVEGDWITHDAFSENGAWGMFLSGYHEYRLVGPDGCTAVVSRIDDRAYSDTTL